MVLQKGSLIPENLHAMLQTPVTLGQGINNSYCIAVQRYIVRL